MSGELFGFAKRFFAALFLSAIAGYVWLIPGSLIGLAIATDSGKYQSAAQIFLLVTLVIISFGVSFVIFFREPANPGMWSTKGMTRALLASAASFVVLACIALYIRSSGGL